MQLPFNHILSIHLIFAVVMLSAFSVNADAIKTPSHVYQMTERVIAEIQLIRSAQKTSDTPRDPGVQVKKKPIHVYGKSLEVLEKVARMQQKLGLTPLNVGQIPIRKVTPAEVYGSSENILEELRRIKKHLAINSQIAEPKLVENKSPSHVYENMWRASYMLDALAGQISPSYVYRNTQYALADLAIVAKKLGKNISHNAPPPIPGKVPKDVNLMGFKSLQNLSRLQRKIKMKGMRVPGFPAGTITPSDVYDTTNLMLAELVRVKVHLGISNQLPTIGLVEGKKPSDVLAQMTLINQSISELRK